MRLVAAHNGYSGFPINVPDGFSAPCTAFSATTSDVTAGLECIEIGALAGDSAGAWPEHRQDGRGLSLRPTADVTGRVQLTRLVVRSVAACELDHAGYVSKFLPLRV